MSNLFGHYRSRPHPPLALDGLKDIFKYLAPDIKWLSVIALAGLCQPVMAQPFAHPGGLHTLADLNRMKTNVVAGNHPWIDDWNALAADSQAQTNYADHATANMGSSRQNADADAHAAYLNFIRWYISGDANFADKAVKICNDWSAAVNQVPSGTDVPGLMGIAVAHFAEVGELLRTYPGWSPANFQSYTNMMVQYLYPSCNSFLTAHNGACISSYWANWDACNVEALIAMGVLCDNPNIYNQGVNYFETGAGNGSISNAVPYAYNGGSLGQWQESGRDQEHAQLGIGELGNACQIAWNQGLDLYGFGNNRLLAGAEYVAQFNLWHNVPFTPYNDCVGDNLFFIANNSQGRLDDRPVYEMLYNHYVVLQGLSAPNTKAMAQLYRPDHGSADHFGYETLTYTLNPSASPSPPAPVPRAPTGLMAQAGIAQITLNWAPAYGDLAQGYTVLRATTSGGPYTNVATWNQGTWPNYTDTSVVNGTTYYYVVSAVNQSGASANSVEVGATPAASGAAPPGWTSQDLGVVTSAGSSAYANAGNNTFNVAGAGTGIGGTGDGGFHYTYVNATNDFTIVARLTASNADQMGLMMRDTLATNAALVQFFMAGYGRESTYGVRLSTGANLNHYASGDQFTALPTWYKLNRSGNTFTACQSADGVNWVAVQSSAATMGADYYAGIAVNSGSATFDNVVYTNAAAAGTFAPPVAPAGLAATAIAGNLVNLTWSAVANALSYNVKRSTTSGIGYSLIASNVAAVGYFDSTASGGATSYYVVSAINGGGESANSIEAGAATSAPSPPAVPAGLTVAPEISQIDLNWAASIGASSYNVKRSTNGTGPFTNVVASGILGAFTDTNVAANIRYYYVVSAVNAVGESPNSFPVSAALGTVMGTPGSYNNLGNTIMNVFDNNFNTFFDGPDASGDWVGLDFGAGVSNVIGFIQYCPRANFASRMVGGVFQGADNPSFTGSTALFTVTAAPAYSVMTSQPITITNAFRYVRYVGPNNANCNAAEIEFDGFPALAQPLAPAGLTAMAGDAQVSLSWNAAAGATGYNLKRSTQTGGPYQLISTNFAGLASTNAGLTDGVLYYFVVAATNAMGESANSQETSARPVSTVPPELTMGISGSQLQFVWPTNHIGWRLQAQTNSSNVGLGTNWVTVSNSISTNQISWPTSETNGGIFFRLVYQ